MGWTEYELGTLLSYEQPTPYIVETTDYKDTYSTPVLTAGKTFIIGYTNETHGIYTKNPVIIFDDFTTSTQYVNFSFKVKSSAMKILSANESLSILKFLYYRMQLIDFDHSTHKRYWIQHYSKIKVKVPSITEQIRIVSRIEELFSELDKAVETMQTIKSQLAVYRQAVLKEAFINCSSSETIDSVCMLVSDGDHMPPPKAKDGVPFIMISNIKDSKILWEGSSYVGYDYFNSIGVKRTPQKGDVLYTVTGSYGIPVLVDFEKDFCFQRHIALMRPSERIEQKFLFYALQCPDVYQQAAQKATGTAQKTVGLSVLRKILIPFIESKHEQISIVSMIESRLSICNSIVQSVNDTLDQTTALRHSILRSAFEGRI